MHYSSRDIFRRIISIFKRDSITSDHQLHVPTNDPSRKLKPLQPVDDKHAKPKLARKGHVAMYVGEEGKRYEVPVRFLSTELFQALIRLNQDDPDDKIDGPIRIPCSTEYLDQMLKLSDLHIH